MGRDSRYAPGGDTSGSQFGGHAEEQHEQESLQGICSRSHRVLDATL